MDLFTWLALGFFVGGLIVIVSLKRGMERRVELLKENATTADSQEVSANPVIWWIVGAVLWSLVSIFLVVRLFSVYS